MTTRRGRLAALVAGAFVFLAVTANPAGAAGTGDQTGPTCGDIHDVAFSASYPHLFVGGIDTQQPDKSKIVLNVDMFFGTASNPYDCGTKNPDKKQRMASKYSFLAQMHGGSGDTAPIDASTPTSVVQNGTGAEREIALTMTVSNTSNGQVCLWATSQLANPKGVFYTADSAPDSPNCAVFDLENGGSGGQHYG